MVTMSEILERVPLTPQKEKKIKQTFNWNYTRIFFEVPLNNKQRIQFDILHR